MKVHFYATLREIVGGRSIEIATGKGMRASELFDAILSRYPALRKELLDPQGQMFGHVHFFINGRDVQFNEAGWETVVQPDDVITVFPAIGGG